MKRNILDYFHSKRITRSSPPYPLLESNRKEFEFQTFYTSNLQHYQQALNEIKQGEKRSHWIWYILPQLACLGSSHHAIWYGIKSFPEAKKYLEDELLGTRLIEISQEILNKLNNGSKVRVLMGSGIDAAKLLSCATLFYFVSYKTVHENLFNNLRKQCERKLNRKDEKTIQFCEVSMERLNFEIPQYHKVNTEEEKDDNNNNNDTDNNNNTSGDNKDDDNELLSSQLSQPFSEITKESSISSTQEITENFSQERSIEKLLHDIPETPTHHPHLHSIPKRSEFNFTPFLNSSNEFYNQALDEMKLGHKSSHWIWFILPQLESLGHSHKSKYFGIKTFEEGLAFLQHYILGSRLIEISYVILEKLQSNYDIDELMGSRIDTLKLLSCSTLFYYISHQLSVTSSTSSTLSPSSSQSDTINENNQNLSQELVFDTNNLSQNSENPSPDYKLTFQLFESLRKICEERIGGKDYKTIEFCEESMKRLNFSIPFLPKLVKDNDENDKIENDMNDSNNKNEDTITQEISTNTENNHENSDENEKNNIVHSTINIDSFENSQEEDSMKQEEIKENDNNNEYHSQVDNEGEDDNNSIDSGSHEYNMDLQQNDENETI